MRSRRKLRNFFRFITSDQISLKIPNKFTQQHRKQILLNDVLLIVSDDKVWSLGWMLSGDGNICLHKGWPEFHQHYCLKPGHLLLFNHLGKCMFHVKIYRQRFNLSPHIFPKQIDQAEIQAEKGKQQSVRNRAVESCKPDGPFYSVTVQDSYLQNSTLYAPVRFCKRYLSGYEKCSSCVLEMPNGGRWDAVKCRIYETYAKLCGKNWKKFSEENHLCVGDVCVFELINEVERVMKVTITRA